MLDAILAQARAQNPRECCGLLLGDARTGAVASLSPAANVAPDPHHRFEIDPAVLIAAHKARRSGGPAIIGHYHSHPAGPAEPSETDARMAEKRGEYWVIVGGQGDATAWRAAPGGTVHGCFTRVDMVIGGGDDPAPGASAQ